MFQNYLSRIYLKKHNQRCWFHWISNFGSRFGLANSDQKRDKFIRVAHTRTRALNKKIRERDTQTFSRPGLKQKTSFQSLFFSALNVSGRI